jgi:hypothetical protein
MSLLGRSARGLVAGAVGTAAFDLWLFARYRQGGGTSGFVDWETSAELTSWDDAPAPALLGKRLVEGVTGRKLGPDRARLVNNLMHWSYGLGNGVEYAVVAGRLLEPPIRYGIPFGAAVFGSDYVILPILKLYKPIWKYDGKTLGNDLAAHLVYGLATAATFRALSLSAAQGR